MSGALAELTDKEFGKAVEKGLTLVDFWAPWCGPCQKQTPVLEQMAQKVGAKARIAKVNVDENMETPGLHGVQSIPTLLLFKEGKEVARFVGLTSEADLIKAIENAGK
jgi:thioredoxin 1